jgi:membrane-associated phospholipid phosphatase
MPWLDAAEARALIRLQRTLARPPVTTVAHGLSSAGEHSWAWLAIAASGMVVDRRRRWRWAEVGASAVVAHGAAVVLKRVVRRPRPLTPGLQVLDATPSRLSFPSAHAASTTAAALSAAPLVGLPIAAPVPVAMGAARLILGVHYPTDVAAGALLGAAGAGLVRRLARGRSE